MMQDTKKYKVSILNETYSLVSDESEQLILKSVETANAILTDIMQKAPSLGTRQSATLALLKVAINLNKLQDELTSYRQKEEELLRFFDQNNSLS